MGNRIGRLTGPCPLLDTLPVEIRIHIFEYILFENGNFFSLGDEEGKSAPILFPRLEAPLRNIDQQHDVRETQSVRCERNGRGNIMSLLLASKQIYDESTSVLYSSAFFRLRGIQSTIQFINAVSPGHLALVRSLKLVWDDQGWTSAPEFDTPTLRSSWPSMCDALATNFPGLRDLYVALSMPSNEALVEELYLSALRRVRHVGNFRVCAPVGVLERFEGLAGRLDERGGGYDDAPFTLCRHTAGEVCSSRREVLTAEWLGARRPSTLNLEVQHPNVPGLEPWTDGEWQSGKDTPEGDSLENEALIRVS